MARKVVMIEDDPDSADIARFFLQKHGFEFHTAPEGLAGLRLAEDVAPDVVLLDLSLPDMDGTVVCRRLRDRSDIPVIMLTGRSGETDRLTGFGLGADDYVVKPFSPRELVARVEALLRRARPGPAGASKELQAGDITVDLDRHEARVRGQLVELTPSQLRILALLARAPGTVVARERILQELVGNSYEREFRTVDAHVSHLRRTLASSGTTTSIRGVYGAGYKLITGGGE